MIERIGWGAVLERLPNPLRHTYTLGVVLIAWVFFRAETLGQALAYLGALLGSGVETGEGQYLVDFVSIVVGVALLAGMLGAPPWWRHLEARMRSWEDDGRLTLGISLGGLLRPLATVVVFVASAMHLATQTFNPFIYFRF